jgi:glutathione S-transferase
VLLEELHLNYKIVTYKRDKNALAPEELKNIHPLGKSPSVEIAIPGQAPFVLAESGAIFEYLCENFGKHLIPARTLPDQDQKPGFESEEFRRNRYFMHYAEGSLMSLLAIAAVIRSTYTVYLSLFIVSETNAYISRHKKCPGSVLHQADY